MILFFDDFYFLVRYDLVKFLVCFLDIALYSAKNTLGISAGIHSSTLDWSGVYVAGFPDENEVNYGLLVTG